MHDRQAKFDDQTLKKCESITAVQHSRERQSAFYRTNGENMFEIIPLGSAVLAWYTGAFNNDLLKGMVGHTSL